MEDFAELSVVERSEISAAMCATFYRGASEAAAAQNGLDEHVYTRYRTALRHVVPWISRRVPLQGARVLEIGVGTGSSTAAMARAGAQVIGFDIDAPALEGARRRLSILGHSAELRHVHPEDLLRALRGPSDVDVVLLYAVLEHMTLQERLDTIETAWARLRPGGVLVVFDTPNRLFFVDYHTSLLPFFHALPDALALRAAAHSPRTDFREAMKSGADDVALARWGRGVSHHEFETVLGDLEPLVVSDGFDPAIFPLLPPTPLENLLREAFVLSGLTVPIGFSRACVDVILRKPGPSLEPLRPDPPPPLEQRPVLEDRCRAAETARVQADAARREADAARLEADAARLEAETARREAETALREATAARRETEVALQASEAARRETVSALRATESAKHEAQSALYSTEKARRELETSLKSIESSISYRTVNAARRMPGFELVRSVVRKVDMALKDTTNEP